MLILRQSLSLTTHCPYGLKARDGHLDLYLDSCCSCQFNTIFPEVILFACHFLQKVEGGVRIVD